MVSRLTLGLNSQCRNNSKTLGSNKRQLLRLILVSGLQNLTSLCRKYKLNIFIKEMFLASYGTQPTGGNPGWGQQPAATATGGYGAAQVSTGATGYNQPTGVGSSGGWSYGK